jgi:hypothetical protein
MKTDIGKDLSRHMQVEIGKVVQRHLDLARIALEPADVLLLLVEAAIGLSISAAASVGTNVPEPARDALIRSTLDQISAAISSDKAIGRIRAAAATGKGGLL